MAKRPSLFHQMLTSLREQECFGYSKYQAKKKAIAEAHAQGYSGFGVAPEGIFSVKTFAAYRQVAREFSDWCKQDSNPRTMEDAKWYVGFYLQYRIDQGLSAWTIYRDRSALRKMFQDPEIAWEIEIPIRKLKNITRSRRPVKMDKYFDEVKYKDLVDFARATGLRRHELEVITPSDIYWRDVQLVAYVAQGKGGKAREVTVLESKQDKVLHIIEGKEINKPIFSKIPKNMDVHGYRAEYATARLNNAEEIEVSRDLGHNRVDIIRSHYIRKK